MLEPNQLLAREKNVSQAGTVAKAWWLRNVLHSEMMLSKPFQSGDGSLHLSNNSGLTKNPSNLSYPLVIKHSCGKSPSFIGKSTKFLWWFSSSQTVSHYRRLILCCLVVLTPLKDMKVSWDDELPNIWKNNPVMFRSSPPTSIVLTN